MIKGSFLIAAIAALALMVTGAQAAPGNLDNAWGSGGVVLTNFGGSDDTAYGVTVQSNGNVIAAGLQEGSTDNIALARYQSKNGALDGTCGSKGKTTASFSSTSNETARGVIARPASEGGQIDVAGWTDANGVDDDFAVMQFTGSACKLDKNWNGSGMTRTDFGGIDHGRALAERSDGKLYVVGVTDVNDPGDTAIARYLKNGKLDTGWQTGGMATYDQSDSSSYDDAVAVLIQPDNKVVTVGTTFGGTPDADCVVSRFNPDGSPDLGFGTGSNGQEIVDFGGQDACFAEAFFGGDIIIAGHNLAGDIVLARISGLDGSVVWSNTYDPTGGAEQINAVQVHNSLIVVAGASDATGSPDDFLIARFDGDGNEDFSFGGGAGYVQTELGGDEGARAMVIKNNKAVAAGNSDTRGTDDFAVLRYTLGS